MFTVHVACIQYWSPNENLKVGWSTNQVKHISGFIPSILWFFSHELGVLCMIVHDVQWYGSHIEEFVNLGSVLQKYRMSCDLEAVQLCSVILN